MPYDYENLSKYVNEIKNLYSIKDFYNYIRQPDNVPSNHRHFQIFFYPQLNNYVIPKPSVFAATMDEEDIEIAKKNDKFNYIHDVYNNITNFLNPSIFRKITLAVQSITIPQQFKFNGEDLNVKTPLGNWNSTGDDSYLDAENHTLTLTLIDQMKPLFEKFFNEWLYIISMCQTESIPSQAFGYGFPRVNIAIKYFREDRVGNNNENLAPNFIYYFRGAYPVTFKTCSIAHAFDQDEAILRTVMFNFNTCWCLSNGQFAKRYKLQYLFNTNEQITAAYVADKEMQQAFAAKAEAVEELRALESKKQIKQKIAKQSEAEAKHAEQVLKKLQQNLQKAAAIKKAIHEIDLFEREQAKERMRIERQLEETSCFDIIKRNRLEKQLEALDALEKGGKNNIARLKIAAANGLSGTDLVTAARRK